MQFPSWNSLISLLCSVHISTSNIHFTAAIERCKREIWMRASMRISSGRLILWWNGESIQQALKISSWWVLVCCWQCICQVRDQRTVFVWHSKWNCFHMTGYMNSEPFAGYIPNIIEYQAPGKIIFGTHKKYVWMEIVYEVFARHYISNGHDKMYQWSDTLSLGIIYTISWLVHPSK